MSLGRAKTAKLWAAAAVSAFLVMRGGAAEPGNSYLVQNLVSDGSVAATHMDPLLINAWGLAALPTSPWWVADNETNVSTLYDAAGAMRPLVVQVPGGPTGIVSNVSIGDRSRIRSFNGCSPRSDAITSSGR